MAPPRYQSAFMDPCTTSTSSASFPPDVGIVSKEEKQTASHVHGSDSSSPLAIVTTTSPTFSTAVPQDQAMTHPEGIPTTAAKPSITSFTQALIQAQAEALLEAQKARESKPPKSSCHTTSIPSRSTPSSPHLEFSTTVTSQTPDKVPSAQQCVVQKDSASNHELAHTPRMQSAPPASSTQIVDTAASSKNTTLATCSATSVVAPDSHGPKCTVASPVTPSLASSESAASHTESVTSPFLSVDPVDDGAWEELFGAAMRDSSLDVGAVSLEDEIERIKSDEAFARKLYNEDLARLKKLEEQERQDEEVARKMQESAAPLPTPASVIAPRSLSPLPSSTGLSDAELAKSFYDEEQHFLKKKLEMEKRDAEIARKMQDEATKTGPPTSTTTTSTTSTDSDPSLALALSLQQEELRILEDTERKDAALARKLAAEEDSYKTPTVHYKAPAGYLTPPPSFVGPPALFPPFGGTLPFPPLTLPVYSTPITTSKPPEIEIAVPQVLSGATVLIISPKSTSPQTVLNLTTSITAAGGRVVKKKVPAVTHVLAVDDEFSAHYQRWLSENPSIKLLTEGELKSMTKPPASLSSSTSAVIKGTPITPTMVIDALSQVSVALGGIMQFGRPAGWKPRVSPVASETLKSRFVAEYENLRDRNGPGNEGLTIAFHGTGKDREQGILSKGLLVPGSSSGVKHRTDSGWYGRGIYLSPQASMAVGYGASGCVFICAVLRGIVKHLTSRLTGKPCLPGYDSHESPDKTEWVIFKSSQILPLYLLRMV
ncbi:hypothetical protein Pelo_14710 [Pelomyxa schiedti]|nr:hypothetical protein Pelo_14710 [Pelomyxa schiedti]